MAIVLVFLYFVPALIASIRKVPNAGSVFVIDLFLGWTIVGWVVAMAMAVRSKPQPVVATGPFGGRYQAASGPSFGAGRGRGAIDPPPPPAPAYPSGWYPDPRGKARLRYHDGNNWTEHAHD